jgi:hypothetical protein
MPRSRSQHRARFSAGDRCRKSAVAVNGRIFPFVEHGGNRLLFEQRMQRAFAMLHAVIRPERLRQAVKLALGVGFDLVLAGKAAVIRRMPVLAGDTVSPRAGSSR